MRAWYIKNMSVGLLYQCSLGDLKLDAPVALLQNRRHEGVDFMEVVPMEHQLPAQRDQVRSSRIRTNDQLMVMGCMPATYIRDRKFVGTAAWKDLSLDFTWVACS